MFEKLKFDKFGYDQFGNKKGKRFDKIEKGDLVQYLSTQNIGGSKKIKVPLRGIWDGEKVEFDDKEHTIVKNKYWLTRVKKCPCCGKKLNRKDIAGWTGSGSSLVS